MLCNSVVYLCTIPAREPHFNALKRIIRYVNHTIDHGLHLYSSAPSRLITYTDADWAGCPDTRRSTSGYCVLLGDNIISWSSKRRATVSRSSAEAGVANVVAETCWLRNLLLELHCSLSRATLVYCDNVSAVFYWLVDWQTPGLPPEWSPVQNDPWATLHIWRLCIHQFVRAFFS